MTTVIYHSADYDGIFCREIVRKFLGDKDVQYIGWNFGDQPVTFPTEGTVYVLDLPLDQTFGLLTYRLVLDLAMLLNDKRYEVQNVVWIDHHKSSIDSHPKDIPGYRIDGVAACRLAWQWFAEDQYFQDPAMLPSKQEFIDRKVREPLAVRLAGEYDVLDHRGDGDLEFQYGLRAELEPIDFELILSDPERLIGVGKICRRYAQNMDETWLKESWHIIEFEGVKFLAQNSVQRGRDILDSMDRPETGHDALMLYGWRGKLWSVSMYHAKHRTDLDLSQIAVKHGGGGHRGACGFTCKELPFDL